MICFVRVVVGTYHQICLSVVALPVVAEREILDVTSEPGRPIRKLDEFVECEPLWLVGYV